MHGFLLYDATLRVPLILRGPGDLRGGIHVTRPVSQVDLMPTLLSLLGVTMPDDMDGIDLTRASGERTLFAETFQGEIDYGWASLRAAMRGNYKLIDAPVLELYDRASDPGELQDIHTTAPERAASLKAELLELHANDPEFATPVTELSPDEIARLEALGYGTGTARSEHPREERANPVEMVPVLLRVQSIGSEIGLGLPPHQAIEALEEIVQDYPDFVPASLMLAHVQERNGDLEAATGTLRRAAAASGGAEMAVLLLAQALTKSGRTDEAISYLQELVTRRPQSLDAHLNLGRLLRASGRPSEALPHLRTAHQLDPEHEPARRAFARAVERQDP
jgi:tetratricopeptide (TPR) repeat protein